MTGTLTTLYRLSGKVLWKASFLRDASRALLSPFGVFALSILFFFFFRLLLLLFQSPRFLSTRLYTHVFLWSSTESSRVDAQLANLYIEPHICGHSFLDQTPLSTEGRRASQSRGKEARQETLTFCSCLVKSASRWTRDTRDDSSSSIGS